MKKNVSIIILNYNREEDTIDCVKSLSKQTYQNFEIIIIDNNSENRIFLELKKKLQQFKDIMKITLIRNNFNLYFAGGMNKGIKIANGNYIGLLGHDVVVTPNFIEEMIKFLENRKDVGFISPKIKVYQNKNLIWYAGANINVRKSCHSIIRGIWQSDPKNQKYVEITTTDYAPGSMCFLKKEIIDKIGLLDEIFFMYYEESDWNFKAKERGYKNYYVPTTILYHKVSKILDKKTQILRSYFFNRNRQIFAWKHAKIEDLAIFYFNYFALNFKNIFIALLNKDIFGVFLRLISILHGLRAGVKRRTNRSCRKYLLKDYKFIIKLQKKKF